MSIYLLRVEGSEAVKIGFTTNFIARVRYYEVHNPGAVTVLRRPPIGELLPSAHDMFREYRIISALADTPVPVAPTVVPRSGNASAARSIVPRTRVPFAVTCTDGAPGCRMNVPSTVRPLPNRSATVTRRS